VRVVCAADGLRMLSGGDDWVIRVWDHLPGQKCDVRLHTHSVTGVSTVFSSLQQGNKLLNTIVLLVADCLLVVAGGQA
jgi:hypothetical protein